MLTWLLLRPWKFASRRAQMMHRCWPGLPRRSRNLPVRTQSWLTSYLTLIQGRTRFGFPSAEKLHFVRLLRVTMHGHECHEGLFGRNLYNLYVVDASSFPSSGAVNPISANLMRGASMGEWLLSRRDRLIVARHEVPG